MQQDIVCHVCSSGEDETRMLLCDQCNRGFHTFCLNLRSVPSESWYCPGCSRTLAQAKPVVQTVVVPKKVYIYIRVSSKGQDDPVYGRVGMDTQNSELLKFCAKNGLFVAKCITEVGSAYRAKTPLLRELITEIQPDTPILVYSFSRFSRNVANTRDMIDLVHSRGSYVWSVTDQMTSRDPSFLNLVKAAENESRLNGQRVSDAYKRVVDRGGFVGKKPFGYNKVRVNGLFKLRKNAVEQAIIGKIRAFVQIRQLNPSSPEILFFVTKRYPKYNWTTTMISNCLHENIDESFVIGGSSAMDGLSEAIAELEDEEDEMVVGNENIQIIRCLHKIRSGQIGVYEILVEWKGMSKCSWENVVSLYEDVPEMVVEFLNRSKAFMVADVKELLGVRV